MNDKKISIIIPIYKVEKYLKKCITSVMEQSYTNLQIILVDDGSPDSCGQICDDLSKADDRIIVIHKENGGLSDARNAGLAYVKGNFVFYLDSDDYLERNALELLMEKQQLNGADVVIGNYYYTYPEHEDKAAFAFEGNLVLNRHESMEELVSGKIQNFAWGKLIRADIAKRHEFPKGKLFEDNYWAHLILNDSNRVVVLDEAIVHYRQREKSISYTYEIKRLDILDGWLARKAFLEEYYPELVDKFLRYVAKNYVNMAWLILTQMKSEKKKAFKKLRQYNSELKLQGYAEQRDKELIKKLDQSVFLYSVTAVIMRIRRGR